MQTEASFIHLVRLGIGHKSEQIPDIPDWKELEDIAFQQGLLTIMVDGITKLPDTSRPPKEQLLQWIGQVLQEEQLYAIQWKASTDLALLLAPKDIYTYVLKGIVVSECYPIPNHRCSIDFDCYLKSSKIGDVWELGNCIVENAGYKVERDFYKNSTWILPGLTVENHKWLTPFRGNKRLTELEKLLQSMLQEEEGKDVIDNTNLCRPPVMVTSLFLIEHAYSHFLHEGLTWRHVLDWVMFSKKHHGEIAWAQLEDWVDAFGFRKFYDSYSRLGRYLIGEISETVFTDQDRVMLNDVWAELDLHETVRGIRGKLALVGNTWRARWKYREFTEISWLQALWIQVKGSVFMKEPKIV